MRYVYCYEYYWGKSGTFLEPFRVSHRLLQACTALPIISVLLVLDDHHHCYIIIRCIIAIDIVIMVGISRCCSVFIFASVWTLTSPPWPWRTSRTTQEAGNYQAPGGALCYYYYYCCYLLLLLLLPLLLLLRGLLLLLLPPNFMLYNGASA